MIVIKKALTVIKLINNRNAFFVYLIFNQDFLTLIGTRIFLNILLY